MQLKAYNVLLGNLGKFPVSCFCIRCRKRCPVLSCKSVFRSPTYCVCRSRSGAKAAEDTSQTIIGCFDSSKPNHSVPFGSPLLWVSLAEFGLAWPDGIGAEITD